MMPLPAAAVGYDGRWQRAQNDCSNNAYKSTLNVMTNDERVDKKFFKNRRHRGRVITLCTVAFLNVLGDNVKVVCTVLFFRYKTFTV